MAAGNEAYSRSDRTRAGLAIVRLSGHCAEYRSVPGCHSSTRMYSSAAITNEPQMGEYIGSLLLP